MGSQPIEARPWSYRKSSRRSLNSATGQLPAGSPEWHVRVNGSQIERRPWENDVNRQRARPPLARVRWHDSVLEGALEAEKVRALLPTPSEGKPDPFQRTASEQRLCGDQPFEYSDDESVESGFGIDAAEPRDLKEEMQVVHIGSKSPTGEQGVPQKLLGALKKMHSCGWRSSESLEVKCPEPHPVGKAALIGALIPRDLILGSVSLEGNYNDPPAALKTALHEALVETLGRLAGTCKVQLMEVTEVKPHRDSSCACVIPFAVVVQDLAEMQATFSELSLEARLAGARCLLPALVCRLTDVWHLALRLEVRRPACFH
mmetsp:Transcript_72511/g.172889  ORF Transcript_72511/g.172889 Transcript_72511/m.172889 type:complete len:317 (+) Transcript_72511:123-1073(+)